MYIRSVRGTPGPPIKKGKLKVSPVLLPGFHLLQRQAKSSLSTLALLECTLRHSADFQATFVFKFFWHTGYTLKRTFPAVTL